MYGKVEYDPIADAFRCEYPIIDELGNHRVCGRWCRDLVRHITRAHKIEAREYKKMLGLDLNESLMSETTKEKLRENGKKVGSLNLEKGRELYQFQKGESKVQSYERSEQTKRRLRNLRRESKEPEKPKLKPVPLPDEDFSELEDFI